MIRFRPQPPPIDELGDDQREFYEHLGEDADVQLEPGYNQDEIFDDQFERRAHEIQRTPSANNAVAVIPAKTGPWTANNNLGIEREFAPDADNRQTILKMPEWGFPEVWTVCLGMNDFTRESSTGFSVTAEIEFGVGGVMQTVEVDWLQGMCLSLPMNAINVIARYDRLIDEGSTTIPEDLRLRVSLARGRSAHPRPTRTVYFPQGVSAIEIPTFTQRAMFLPLVQVPAPSPFAFYSADNYVALLTTLAGGPGDQRFSMSQLTDYLDFTNQRAGAPVWVPIQPFQRLIQTQNNLGAASAATGLRSVLFELAF